MIVLNCAVIFILMGIKYELIWKSNSIKEWDFKKKEGSTECPKNKSLCFDTYKNSIVNTKMFIKGETIFLNYWFAPNSNLSSVLWHHVARSSYRRLKIDTIVFVWPNMYFLGWLNISDWTRTIAYIGFIRLVYNT